MYRLLVLDLDGTILDREGRLADGDVAAAQALRERGVGVTLCTGRLFTGTQWVAQELGVRGSVGVANGSELIDADSGQTRHGVYVDRDARMLARQLLEDSHLTPLLFSSRTIHLGRASQWRAPYLSIWTPRIELHDELLEASAWDDEDIVAVSAVGEPAAIDVLRRRLHSELSGEYISFLFTTSGGESFLELRRGCEDKGTALARLAAERGHGPEETVAVGDWLNDLPMFERAGRCFAMGQSTPEVKAAAGETLVAEHSGAIAEVAERVWGIRA